MKPERTFARVALATACILAVVSLQPVEAWAQDDMTDMPGMALKTTPAPKKSNPSATSTPVVPATSQADMDAMPGMSPTKPAASKPSEPTPATSGMAGMAQGNVSASPRMSTPGVTILRQPQKWMPPRGDNRAAELLSRPALEEFMRPLPTPVEDSMFHSLILSELLEYRANTAGPNTFVWDFVGWFGGDYNRLWIKTEGRQDLSAGNRGEGDLQLLYGRLIAPFWDFQIGVRGKQNLGNGFAGNSRTYAVIGLQGLAPGNFEVEPTIYISDRGEVSAELTVSADLYLTQRLVLQPRFQGEVSLQGDERFGTGEGVTETDIGLRLRYEIAREFAPYIGISWLRSYGDTARITRQEGETDASVAFLVGLRLWW